MSRTNILAWRSCGLQVDAMPNATSQPATAHSIILVGSRPRAHLEYFNALTFNPEGKIELVTNILRRPMFFDKLRDHFFDLLCLELAQRHDLPTPSQPPASNNGDGPTIP